MFEAESLQTAKSLIDAIPTLGKRWVDNVDYVYYPLAKEYGNHFLETTNHNVSFKHTGYKDTRNIKILFFHFSFMKYELEALELPMYTSTVLPNAQIDMCYFDGRGNFGNKNEHYIASVNGCETAPKREFLDHYDILIVRSSSLSTIKTHLPDLYDKCDYKINIQTNNYKPNFNLGEDFSFSHTEFYAPAGRKFHDRSLDLINDSEFSKYNIVTMVGTQIWWKGQLEWI